MTTEFCNESCIMSLDILSYAEGGRPGVVAYPHPECRLHSPDPVRDLVGPVVERRIAEFDPGRWPILIAASFVEGAHWAQAYGLPEKHIAPIGWSSALGTRPTAVLYAPGWYLAPDIAQAADELAALLARYPKTPIHYIIEGRF